MYFLLFWTFFFFTYILAHVVTLLFLLTLFIPALFFGTHKKSIEEIETGLLKQELSIPFYHRYLGIHVLHIPCLDESIKHVILVHGTAGSCLTYLHTFKHLAKVFHVHAIDLPGFGRSEGSGLGFSEVIKNYLLTLKIEKAVFVGHSFGGFICTQFAADYPSFVEKLVLIGTVGIFPTLGDLGAYWGVFFKFSLANFGRRFGRVGLTVAKFILEDENLYWYSLLSNPNSYGDKIVASNIHLSVSGCFWKNPILELFGRVNTPVILMYGACDNIIPPHQGQILNHLYGFPLFVIKNGKHNLTKLQARHVARNIIFSSSPSPIKITTSLVNLGPPSLFKSSFNRKQTTSIIQKLYTLLKE
jgi:pimeloyl-ACP methyl ester carboxylesterase